MAESKSEGEGFLDAQFTSRDECHAANYLDAYGEGYVNANNRSETCGEAPKKAIPPPIMDHGNATDDSSESICRVDLPNDLIVSSPMKISDILSLLLDSPEKTAAAALNEISLDGNGSINEIGIHENGIASSNQPLSNHSTLLRRSHSCQIDDGQKPGRDFHCGDVGIPEKSLSVSERSKSLGDIYACHPQPTSSTMHPWFQPISVVGSAVDTLNDIYETIHADQHQHKSGPSVNILGYSLPLVSVDGDSADHVCVTDVFQTFFGTRHWDEFKTILEKNGIRTVSASVHSNGNAFGMPEIVDVIDVKQVESLLLSNQARKDGFVRCVRLSMDGETSGLGSSSSTTESKIIMMPERQVGELSSGIRTRHADQSDIVYVELDGQTLPSIMLSGVQYVRLVDVQQKFLKPAPSESDDKPQPSLNTTALAKQLQMLKKVCASLKIPVLKCRPNEKARMVVYAHSWHSSSLHIIAADQLPRLIQCIRLGKKRSNRKSLPKSSATKRSKTSGLINGNGSLRISIMDDWSSDFSQSLSTPSGLSPLSRPDSFDSESSEAFSELLSAPTSPVDTSSKSIGIKRRATLDGRSDSIPKRSYKNSLYYPHDRTVGHGNESQAARNSPVSIWANGHLKKYPSDPPSPVLFNLDDSMIFEGGPTSKISGTDESGPQNASFTGNIGDDAISGREVDNLIDVFTPNGTISPCRIVVHHSPALPVVVYNRRGCRGPAGKYFDHLFVSKNSACIWCFGCNDFLCLREFINHAHDQAIGLSNPQLFMWITSLRDANMDLWRSLIEKAKKFRLSTVIGYNLPEDFCPKDHEEKELSGGTSQPETGLGAPPKSVRNGSRRSSQQVTLGGAPTPPPPPAFRRRQVRGDAFLDVLERYSAPGFKPPLDVGVVGLNLDSNEKAVDAAYTV